MANVQKRILYVGACPAMPYPPVAALTLLARRTGGIEEGVTKEILHAAFIPFGDLLDVQVPQDHATRAQAPASRPTRVPCAPLRAHGACSAATHAAPPRREEPGLWICRV